MPENNKPTYNFARKVINSLPEVSVGFYNENIVERMSNPTPETTKQLQSMWKAATETGHIDFDFNTFMAKMNYNPNPVKTQVAKPVPVEKPVVIPENTNIDIYSMANTEFLNNRKGAVNVHPETAKTNTAVLQLQGQLQEMDKFWQDPMKANNPMLVQQHNMEYAKVSQQLQAEKNKSASLAFKPNPLSGSVVVDRDPKGIYYNNEKNIAEQVRLFELAKRSNNVDGMNASLSKLSALYQTKSNFAWDFQLGASATDDDRDTQFYLKQEIKNNQMYAGQNFRSLFKSPEKLQQYRVNFNFDEKGNIIPDNTYKTAVNNAYKNGMEDIKKSDPWKFTAYSRMPHMEAMKRYLYEQLIPKLRTYEKTGSSGSQQYKDLMQDAINLYAYTTHNIQAKDVPSATYSRGPKGTAERFYDSDQPAGVIDHIQAGLSYGGGFVADVAVKTAQGVTDQLSKLDYELSELTPAGRARNILNKAYKDGQPVDVDEILKGRTESSLKSSINTSSDEKLNGYYQRILEAVGQEPTSNMPKEKMDAYFSENAYNQGVNLAEMVLETYVGGRVLGAVGGSIEAALTSTKTGSKAVAMYYGGLALTANAASKGFFGAYNAAKTGAMLESGGIIAAKTLLKGHQVIKLGTVYKTTSLIFNKDPEEMGYTTALYGVAGSTVVKQLLKLGGASGKLFRGIWNNNQNTTMPAVLKSRTNSVINSFYEFTVNKFGAGLGESVEETAEEISTIQQKQKVDFITAADAFAKEMLKNPEDAALFYGATMGMGLVAGAAGADIDFYSKQSQAWAMKGFNSLLQGSQASDNHLTKMFQAVSGSNTANGIISMLSSSSKKIQKMQDIEEQFETSAAKSKAVAYAKNVLGLQEGTAKYNAVINQSKKAFMDVHGEGFNKENDSPDIVSLGDLLVAANNTDDNIELTSSNDVSAMIDEVFNNFATRDSEGGVKIMANSANAVEAVNAIQEAIDADLSQMRAMEEQGLQQTQEYQDLKKTHNENLKNFVELKSAIEQSNKHATREYQIRTAVAQAYDAARRGGGDARSNLETFTQSMPQSMVGEESIHNKETLSNADLQTVRGLFELSERGGANSELLKGVEKGKPSTFVNKALSMIGVNKAGKVNIDGISKFFKGVGVTGNNVVDTLLSKVTDLDAINAAYDSKPLKEATSSNKKLLASKKTLEDRVARKTKELDDYKNNAKVKQAEAKKEEHDLTNERESISKEVNELNVAIKSDVEKLSYAKKKKKEATTKAAKEKLDKEIKALEDKISETRTKRNLRLIDQKELTAKLDKAKAKAKEFSDDKVKGSIIDKQDDINRDQKQLSITDSFLKKSDQELSDLQKKQDDHEKSVADMESDIRNSLDAALSEVNDLAADGKISSGDVPIKFVPFIGIESNGGVNYGSNLIHKAALEGKKSVFEQAKESSGETGKGVFGYLKDIFRNKFDKGYVQGSKMRRLVSYLALSDLSLEDFYTVLAANGYKFNTSDDWWFAYTTRKRFSEITSTKRAEMELIEKDLAKELFGNTKDSSIQKARKMLNDYLLAKSSLEKSANLHNQFAEQASLMELERKAESFNKNVGVENLKSEDANTLVDNLKADWAEAVMQKNAKRIGEIRNELKDIAEAASKSKKEYLANSSSGINGKAKRIIEEMDEISMDTRVSGLSNREANEIIDSFDNVEAVDEYAKKYAEAVSNARIDALLLGGIIDSKQAVALKSRNEFYVPFKTFAELEDSLDPDNKEFIGPDISKTLAKVKGRKVDPDTDENMLDAYLPPMEVGLAALNRSLSQAESNEVMVKFMNFIESAPEISKGDDFVVKVVAVDNMGNVKDDDNNYEVPFYHNGQKKALRFSTKEMKNVFSSMSVKQIEGMDIASRLANYYRKIKTTWSPIWATKNIAKDIQTAHKQLPFLGLKNVYLPELLKEVAKANGHLFGISKDSDYSDIEKEAMEAGALFGRAELLRTVDEYKRNQKAYRAGRSEMFKGLRAATLDAYDNLASQYAGNLENATRLAVYKIARKNGKTKREAGHIARESTTNFDRKGDVFKNNPSLNSILMFTSIGVQGNYRSFRNTTRLDMNGRQQVEKLIWASAIRTAQALLGYAAYALMTPDDKEEEINEYMYSHINQLVENMKKQYSSNIFSVKMFGESKYTDDDRNYSISSAQGDNFTNTVVDNLMIAGLDAYLSSMNDKHKPMSSKEHLIRLINAGLKDNNSILDAEFESGSYLPDLASGATVGFLQPLFDLFTNQDSFNREIANTEKYERAGSSVKGKYNMAKDKTGIFWTATSKLLYETSGSAIDIFPETLAYVSNSYLPITKETEVIANTLLGDYDKVMDAALLSKVKTEKNYYMGRLESFAKDSDLSKEEFFDAMDIIQEGSLKVFKSTLYMEMMANKKADEEIQKMVDDGESEEAVNQKRAELNERNEKTFKELKQQSKEYIGEVENLYNTIREKGNASWFAEYRNRE